MLRAAGIMAMQLLLASASVSGFVVVPAGVPRGARGAPGAAAPALTAQRVDLFVDCGQGTRLPPPRPQAASLRLAMQQDAGADLQKMPRLVLVAGATGRVGTMVCEQVLVRIPNARVRAVSRNKTNANVVLDKLQRDYPGRIELVECDLGKRRQLRAALNGVDQVVYCASAFRAPRGNILQKIGRLIKLKLSQTFGRALDIRGPALCCKMLHKLEHTAPWSLAHRDLEPSEQVPRIVMLSSAAVTRPTWDEDKRAQYPEASSIAIVKLNPLNVLGTKLRGENKLKLVCAQKQVPYTIIRSTGERS